MKKKMVLGLALSLSIFTGTLASAANFTAYTIQSGDTLWAISQKFNVSLTDIQAANPTVNPSNLVVGQTVNIPVIQTTSTTLATSATLTTSTTSATSTTPSVYIVQSGDNFWSISQKLNVSWSSLVAANPNVQPTNMYVGMKINVPSASTSTSSTVATTTTSTTPATTTPAQTAPTSTTSATSAEPTAPAAAPVSTTAATSETSTSTSPNIYIVQSGDNFWSISQKLNVSWSSLVAANPDVQPTNMYVGMKINVPSTSTSSATVPTPTTPTTTTSTSTSTSTTAPSTTTTSTVPASTVPTSTAPATNQYVIQSGDTFWALSQKFNVTVDDLINANPTVNPNNLYVGLKINIPTKDTTVTIPTYLADGLFPLKPGTYTPFTDTFGDSRTYNATGDTVRQHEGVDIMSPIGTPIYSAYNGTVINKGWNTLGGWRLTVKTPDGKTAFYYAHMSAYANGVEIGSSITKGQLIGYVGNTGYGPEGTSGLFDPHLHFGMYDITNGFVAVDPYNNLKYWERTSLTAKY